MPGINEEMFQRAVDIDYQSLGKKAEKLAEALAKAGKAHVTTGSGTDISFSVAGRKIEQDTGLLRKRGDITNLPAGEVYVSPDEGTSNGLVVVDHMADICRPKTRVAVHNGVAQEVDGDERFRAMLWSAKNGRNVAEFGIGLNPKAVLSGDVLEDEKALGTCHIAFGSSFAIGGRVHADVHLDAILLNPTITFDGRKIMAGGELLL
jgi:leucyl aminopeptidase (aminopeptidase T)